MRTEDWGQTHDPNVSGTYCGVHGYTLDAIHICSRSPGHDVHRCSCGHEWAEEADADAPFSGRGAV